MEDISKDKRFLCLLKDPKFKTIPRNERKIKIDRRFQSMFKDKQFSVKFTIDKRGRPLNQTSAENLRKYYNISSSEKDSSDEESQSYQKNVFIKEKFQNTKAKSKKNKGTSKITGNQIEGNNNSSYKNVNNQSEFIETKKQLRTEKKIEKIFNNNVKKKLKDLNVDYARGEEILLSDSSSYEGSSESEDEEQLDHNWGELDKDTEITDIVTNRLAICNMDWDRIRAIDLMVLFNSFLPTGGLIDSVTIYPSEFGLHRMKDEELKGPIELIEIKNKNHCEKCNNNTDNENEEGSSYHMEKLRQYQLNRLKYYYAVIVFDSANTANKIYIECDGLEYESSSTKLDLRFIPDSMVFYHEPKEFCNELPDLIKYKPRQFTTTALQQVKVDLTWDETNLQRQEITQKLKYQKFQDIDENDIQTYLANGSSEDETEDKITKQLERINPLNIVDNPIGKYKLLLKSIEQIDKEKNNKEVELEFTWGLNIKEKAEKLVQEKIKRNENLTPFQRYLEKYKTKKKAKRKQKRKISFKDNIKESKNEDFISSNIEINDSYFLEKKKKKTMNIDVDGINKDKRKKEKAELELLLMDEDKNNKNHFNMKRIEEIQILTKSKIKKKTMKTKDSKKELVKDNFEIDVKDPRFNALFTSHHYNIDPTDSHYRKTKGTEALIEEKINRRVKNDIEFEMIKKFSIEENNYSNFKDNIDLYNLIKSIKRNTKFKNV